MLMTISMDKNREPIRKRKLNRVKRELNLRVRSTGSLLTTRTLVRLEPTEATTNRIRTQGAVMMDQTHIDHIGTPMPEMKILKAN